MYPKLHVKHYSILILFVFFRFFRRFGIWILILKPNVSCAQFNQFLFYREHDKRWLISNSILVLLNILCMYAVCTTWFTLRISLFDWFQNGRSISVVPIEASIFLIGCHQNHANLQRKTSLPITKLLFFYHCVIFLEKMLISWKISRILFAYSLTRDMDSSKYQQ